MNHVRQKKLMSSKREYNLSDTGHIHTTISTLEERVKEINKLLKKKR